MKRLIDMEAVMSTEDDRQANGWLGLVIHQAKYEAAPREVYLREYTKLQLNPPSWHSHPWIRDFMKWNAA